MQRINASHQTGNRLYGVTICLLAFSIMPAMDAIAKYLATYLPVIQVTWGRYFFHLLMIAPIVFYRYGIAALKPEQFILQVARGGFLLGATLCFFTALVYLPLADALAIIFISPLLVTLLSPFFLGETVGKVRIIAALIGFVGTLIIIRPGTENMNIGSLIALGTGIMYTCYSISTRKLSGSSPPLVTLAFTALLGTIILSLALPFYWHDLTLIDIGLMVAMGGAGALSQYFFIKAYDYAEASYLAPFGYFEIITATLFGWIFFNDFPDSWTWLGTAIVIASGIFISLRERSLAR
ncbi:MAG: DMT family transporter [Rhodospirillales bacterium]|jgi:drug/metabolite transporter (DMT)-like permease|nr:DMT family transporter [Rhodospirillales bacterium]